MKILAEQILVRVLVEYDEHETLVLKAIGWLPPYVQPCARMWSTKAEIEETAKRLAKKKEGCS